VKELQIRKRLGSERSRSTWTIGDDRPLAHLNGLSQKGPAQGEKDQ